MGTISNDFVTIEYENNYQQKIANCYIELFNAKPEYYKGLLNGKTIIHSDELLHIPEAIVKIGMKYEYYENLIIEDIQRLNGVKEPYSYCTPSSADIYHAIRAYLKGKDLTEPIIKSIQYELACDYFNKTKDFKYLKRCIYENYIPYHDVRVLCSYNIENNFDELMRERIEHEIYRVEKNPYIESNLVNIIILLDQTWDSVLKHVEEMKEDIKNLGLDVEKEDNKEYLPRVDEPTFEKLVREALIYMDPSITMLNEYLKAKKENRIIKRNYDPNEEYINCFVANKDGDYKLHITRKGNIIDIINFIHEFGHMHYYLSGDKDINVNPLFEEYVSIYFELKANEFLVKKGYPEELVRLAESIRTTNNIDNILYLTPLLHTVYINKGLEKENYDLSPINDLINCYDKPDPNMLEFGMSEEEIKEMLDSIKTESKHNLIGANNDIIVTASYIVGTYLAEHSIKNLKHEKVLDILEKIRNKGNSIYRIIKMTGINPDDLGLKDNHNSNKTKCKKIPKQEE
jgi:hypothetical protein